MPRPDENQNWRCTKCGATWVFHYRCDCNECGAGRKHVEQVDAIRETDDAG